MTKIGILIIPVAYLPLSNFEIALRSIVLYSNHGGIIPIVQGRSFASVKCIKLISTEKYF